MSSIFVMRHAEKPDDFGDPHLSAAGEQRAQRLATYIPESFGPPEVIFATAVSHISSRPLETVQPLALACGLEVQTPFKDNEVDLLASKLLNEPSLRDKRIVVCWHHRMLPQLMQGLGCSSGDYPNPWDPAVFNLILQVSLASAGTPTVTQVVEPF